MQEVLNNNLIGQIKGDISRGEARLQELTTRLGDAHPQVQETRASLAEMRTRLDTETRKSTTPPPIGAQQPAASEYTGLTELSLWALRIPATAPAGLSYRPGGYLERYAVGEYVFHLWSSSLCDDAYLASASTNPTAAAQDLQECRALRRWYYQQLVAIGFPLRSRQGDAVPTLAEDDFVYATTSSSVPAPTPPSPYTDATAYRQLVLSLLTPARFHANDAPFMYVRGFIDTEVPCWNGGTHRFVPRPANLRWRALTLDGARQTPYQNLEQENSALLRAQSLTSNAVAPTAAQSMGRVGLPGALALELSDVQLINSPADGLGINNVDVDLNTVTMVNTQRGGLTVVGRSCARITNVVMTSAAAQPGDQLGTINIEPTLGGIGGFGDALHGHRVEAARLEKRPGGIGDMVELLPPLALAAAGLGRRGSRMGRVDGHGELKYLFTTFITLRRKQIFVQPWEWLHKTGY